MSAPDREPTTDTSFRYDEPFPGIGDNVPGLDGKTFEYAQERATAQTLF